MKKIAFLAALLASQSAMAEPAHLTYEKLIDCVELSLTLDDMLREIQVQEGLDGLQVSNSPGRQMTTRDKFNDAANQFNAQCSYTTYSQDELAMICTNEPYDTSMFCKTMAW